MEGWGEEDRREDEGEEWRGEEEREERGAERRAEDKRIREGNGEQGRGEKVWKLTAPVCVRCCECVHMRASACVWTCLLRGCVSLCM